MAEYVYDRTAQDVSDETDKGFINYTDLNRIENACKELYDELMYYAYTINEELTIKLDWHYEDGLGADDIENIPTKEHIDRIHHNVVALRRAYYTYPDTPDTPESLEYATFETFNDVEHILHDLHMMIEDMKEHMKRRRCNTFNCGEM